MNASDGALLDATSLRLAHHADSIIVGVGAAYSNRRASETLVGAAVVYPVLVCVGCVRMVTAGAHWHSVLRNMKVRSVSRASSRLPCTVYSISSRTSRDNNILAVLEGSLGIGAHDIAQVRWSVGGADLRV